jgi:hypothetical protein
LPFASGAELSGHVAVVGGCSDDVDGGGRNVDAGGGGGCSAPADDGGTGSVPGVRLLPGRGTQLLGGFVSSHTVQIVDTDSPVFVSDVVWQHLIKW